MFCNAPTALSINYCNLSFHLVFMLLSHSVDSALPVYISLLQPHIVIPPSFVMHLPSSEPLMSQVIEATKFSGAVRHGAECFNFYFPQDAGSGLRGYPEAPMQLIFVLRRGLPSLHKGLPGPRRMIRVVKAYRSRYVQDKTPGIVDPSAATP